MTTCKCDQFICNRQILQIGFFLWQALLIRIANLERENQALRSQLAVLMARLDVLEAANLLRNLRRRQPEGEKARNASKYKFLFYTHLHCSICVLAMKQK